MTSLCSFAASAIALAAPAIALLSTVLVPRFAVAAGPIVINEVDYDQVDVDTTEFIELKNVSSDPVSLSGYTVTLHNGATSGSNYATFTLPNVILPAGGHFVLCGNNTLVASCDLDVAPDSNLIQNGAPDGIALRLAGTPVDRVSYEGNTTGITEGTPAGTDDPNAGVKGLSRCPDGADTEDNGADFSFRLATPGLPNDCGGGGGGPEIGLCGETATAISAIQGTGATSPLAGQTVVIEGVVVGDFQTAGINGFFVQEEDGQADGDPASSEGIFVFEGALGTAVARGQLVRVRGSVVEFDGLTELTNVTDIVVCPASVMATPVAVTLPVPVAGFLERYEGMAIEIAQTLTVTGNFELGRYGSLDLSAGGRLFQPTQMVAPGAAAIAQQSLNERSRIVLDDASTVQNPNPFPYRDAANTRRVGDTVTGLAGVLDGRLGAYRVQVEIAPTFVGSNPRPSSPPAVGGRLRAASFNVLNFFTTLDNGSPTCGPTGGLDCRGANNSTEFDRQKTKLLNAMAALQADVFALMEIENNASAAVESLVDGLNARGVGPYAYVDTGTIGTDAIKLALIYRSDKVQTVGSHRVLTSAIDPRFIDTKNRPALAQTFAEIATTARFTVVVNHLKSKGSACADVGDPDTGDGSGNCNLTRANAASALRDWIAGDPTGSGDPDYLLLGDLNSYAQEEPIKRLEAGGLSLLPSAAAVTTARSFQFMGQSGSLDHALSTPSLTPQVTGAAEWHINADEPVIADYNTEFKTDDPFDAATVYRASDHDPIVVGLALAGPAAAVRGLGWVGQGGLALALLGLSVLGRRRR